MEQSRVPGKDKLLPRKKMGTFCPKDVSIFGKRLRLFLISPNVLSGRTYCCGKRSLRKTFPLWLPSGRPYHRNILRTDIYRKEAQNESMERFILSECFEINLSERKEIIPESPGMRFFRPRRILLRNKQI